jgi:uncharacterized membrane protein
MSPSTLRAIGVVATLWNLVGVASYLAHVGLFGEAAAAPPEGGAEMPVAITAAFAIAVFAGAIGSMGIALLKRWAEPVLWISLIATLIDWVWVLRSAFRQASRQQTSSRRRSCSNACR